MNLQDKNNGQGQIASNMDQDMNQQPIMKQDPQQQIGVQPVNGQQNNPDTNINQQVQQPVDNKDKNLLDPQQLQPVASVGQD